MQPTMSSSVLYSIPISQSPSGPLPVNMTSPYSRNVDSHSSGNLSRSLFDPALESMNRCTLYYTTAFDSSKVNTGFLVKVYVSYSSDLPLPVALAQFT